MLHIGSSGSSRVRPLLSTAKGPLARSLECAAWCRRRLGPPDDSLPAHARRLDFDALGAARRTSHHGPECRNSRQMIGDGLLLPLAPAAHNSRALRRQLLQHRGAQSVHVVQRADNFEQERRAGHRLGARARRNGLQMHAQRRLELGVTKRAPLRLVARQLRQSSLGVVVTEPLAKAVEREHTSDANVLNKVVHNVIIHHVLVEQTSKKRQADEAFLLAAALETERLAKVAHSRPARDNRRHRPRQGRTLVPGHVDGCGAVRDGHVGQCRTQNLGEELAQQRGLGLDRVVDEHAAPSEPEPND